jgi:hypothetical protein
VIPRQERGDDVAPQETEASQHQDAHDAPSNISVLTEIYVRPRVASSDAVPGRSVPETASTTIVSSTDGAATGT